MKKILANAIKSAAAEHKLDPELIAAIVIQESAANPWAFRYEPAFYRRYIKGHDRHSLPGFVPHPIPTLSTEKTARATSWGLMQIMGETAREQGYQGYYLTELLDPDINCDIGAAFLAKLLRHNSVTAALLRYNGGGDTKYPDKIFEHIETGRIERIL